MHAVSLRAAGLPRYNRRDSELFNIINVQDPNSCLPGRMIKSLVVGFAVHWLFLIRLCKTNEDGPPLLPLCPT